MRYFIFLIALATIGCASHADDIPANPQPFAVWLDEFKQQAAADGVSQATLDNAFANTQAPISRIITLDRKQPESQITIDEYLKKTVTKARIEAGREAYDDNRALLNEIGQRYGVQPKYIVALWGIETNYGDNIGGFVVVDALATLAYDGRRSDFFRDELIKALHILDSEHMAAQDMKGSWAGAMGQCQFMPSSFLKYAVDYDGSGQRDIWNDNADVFASIANYLHSEGWDPQGDVKQDSTNYKVLLKWNRSRYFVAAVSKLANAVEDQ